MNDIHSYGVWSRICHFHDSFVASNSVKISESSPKPLQLEHDGQNRLFCCRRNFCQFLSQSNTIHSLLRLSNNGVIWRIPHLFPVAINHHSNIHWCMDRIGKCLTHVLQFFGFYYVKLHTLKMFTFHRMTHVEFIGTLISCK